MKTCDVLIHCSVINHWAEILTEQARLLRHVRLQYNYDFSITVCFNGFMTHAEHIFARRLFKLAGFPSIEMLCPCIDTDKCEAPTIFKLSQRSNSRTGPVLYMHGKGAAHPGSLYRTLWRWHMNHYLVQLLPAAFIALQEKPWVSAIARPAEPVPHAAGNYFLTTYEFLATLPFFPTFQDQWLASLVGTHSHLLLRHADEMWLGSTNTTGHQMAPSSHEPWRPEWWSAHPSVASLVTQMHL